MKKSTNIRNLNHTPKFTWANESMLSAQYDDIPIPG